MILLASTYFKRYSSKIILFNFLVIFRHKRVNIYTFNKKYVNEKSDAHYIYYYV